MIPDITIGVVNCNRLYYLAATIDSILLTTQQNKIQLIIVDNASVEPGTDEYVQDIINEFSDPDRVEICYYRQQSRDPKNEYAKALNYIALLAKADLVLPMPGDVQFIEKNWLFRYKRLFKNNKDTIGCAAIDAQRKIRLSKEVLIKDSEDFYIAPHRPPIAGAGNVIYHKDILKRMYPWDTNNGTHEGTEDNSETKMLKKMTEHLASEGRYMYLPSIPCAAAICNPDGSTAFVRDNKRYGQYTHGKYLGNMYYEIRDSEPKHLLNKNRPISIEQITLPYEWEQPLDPAGNWIKLANDYSEFTLV